MYARAVPRAMVQFVLEIEKLSHIMGTAPIVELARAYGLHPRLWLLIIFYSNRIRILDFRIYRHFLEFILLDKFFLPCINKVHIHIGLQLIK